MTITLDEQQLRALGMIVLGLGLITLGIAHTLLVRRLRKELIAARLVTLNLQSRMAELERRVIMPRRKDGPPPVMQPAVPAGLHPFDIAIDDASNASRPR